MTPARVIYGMTMLDWIDSQLRLLAMVRGKAKELGRSPSAVGIDELLDARLEWCRTKSSKQPPNCQPRPDQQQWHAWLTGDGTDYR
ncbi:hypothetical protein B5P44_09030 [Mycobacterium sp. CBMA 213]|nr:hypothetical protein [Mycolicibacterium sp. CBMA 213]